MFYYFFRSRPTAVQYGGTMMDSPRDVIGGSNRKDTLYTITSSGGSDSTPSTIVVAAPPTENNPTLPSSEISVWKNLKFLILREYTQWDRKLSSKKSWFLLICASKAWNNKEHLKKYSYFFSNFYSTVSNNRVPVKLNDNGHEDIYFIL